MELNKVQSAGLSIFSNLSLTILKLVVGIFSGSMAIIAESAHSAFDLVASFIAYFSVRVSDRPADRDHPYGHTKIENISGLLEAILILGVSIWIVYKAIEKIQKGTELSYVPLGIGVMLVSLLANIMVSRLLYRVARRTGSIALEADAAHLYSDVLTSAGVILALGVIYLGEKFWGLKLYILDPIFSIFIAVWILGIAYRLTLKSYPALIDGRANPEIEAEIAKEIRKFCAGQCQFHKLRTRQAGSVVHIDFHLQFVPDTHIDIAHQISHQLKARIEKNIKGSEVIIHLEPFEQEDAVKKKSSKE